MDDTAGSGLHPTEGQEVLAKRGRCAGDSEPSVVLTEVLALPSTGAPMVAITKAAGAYLTHVLEQDPVGQTVRLVFGLRGLEPQPSAVLPGDTTFEHQGRTVLVLDEIMSQMLGDKTLDVEETEDGPRLRLL